MPMPQGARIALREFLVERRRRLGPAGLSQAEVASLAGFSLNWYALLESGRNDRRVSARCIEAIAEALQLEGDDRLHLFRLAMPRNDAARRIAESMQDGAFASLRAIRDLSRKLALATQLAEVATVVAEAMHGIGLPDSATIGTLQNGGDVDGFAFGKRAAHVSKTMHQLFWRSRCKLPSDHIGINEGRRTPEELLRTPLVSDIIAAQDGTTIIGQWHWTPDLYRRTVYPTHARSVLTLPLIEARGLSGLIGLLWTKPREFSPLEIETARTVAAVVEHLTSASGSG